MNSIFVGLIFLFLALSVYAQDFRLGLTADILTGNKNLNYQFGPSIEGEYDFEEIPISLKGKIGFHLSELSDENNLSAGYTSRTVSTGYSINYYPINWDIEPYIGLGFVITSSEMKQSGNIHPDAAGKIRTVELENNSFSPEVNIGLKFSAKSWINFLVEMSYMFNKSIEIISSNSMFYTKETISFNSLFVRVGLLFKL